MNKTIRFKALDTDCITLPYKMVEFEMDVKGNNLADTVEYHENYDRWGNTLNEIDEYEKWHYRGFSEFIYYYDEVCYWDVQDIILVDSERVVLYFKDLKTNKIVYRIVNGTNSLLEATYKIFGVKCDDAWKSFGIGLTNGLELLNISFE